MDNIVLKHALVFLLQTIFNLYLLALLLRIILQWSGAHYYNPICQFIIKVTDPVVRPIRKFIPSFHGIDLASFLILLVLELVKLILILLINTGGLPNIVGLIVIGFGDLINVCLNIFFFAIIIVALLSWINPGLHNPFTEILYLVTEPLLQPARRLLPSLGGIDISPIIVLIILQLLSIIIANPLIVIGRSLAIG